jgi:hypothetical protein
VAEDRCPWLNSATASGVLNGPAESKVHRTADGGTTCLFFTRVPASSTLSIVVTSLDAMKGVASFDRRQCTSPIIPLKGIGNEAQACSIETGHEAEEKVTGRVRDKRFTVYIEVSAASDQPFDRKALQQQAENIAEQVAGSLF